MSFFSGLFKREGKYTGKGQPRLMPVFAVGFLIGLLGYLVVQSMPDENGNMSASQVPVVKAEAEPYKVVPEDRGGMEIAHQDSTIYQAMRGEGPDESPQTERIENLLSDESMDSDETLRSQRARNFAGLKTEEEKEKKENIVIADISEPMPGRVPNDDMLDRSARAPKTPKEPETPDPSAADAGVHESLDDIIARAAGRKAGTQENNDTQMIAQAEALARMEPAAGTMGQKSVLDAAQKTHYVQLSSVREESAAQSAWSGMQKKYGVLQDAAYRVQKADLGARGTFYRLQAGPFPEDYANQVCTAIKSQSGGSCLVVRK